jgi:alkylation response protein AidB-like acyl-CoA dehydrogenase
MDFNDTPEEAEYRAKARAWLEENAPRGVKGASLGDEDESQMEAAKAWQAKKAAAGYAQIRWPKEWGGGGGTTIQSVIFGQEESRMGVSLGGPFAIGLGMCLPTVMATADDETKKRFVGPAVRGEEIWCQLFSEPAGGSDVAAIRTRAVKDPGSWSGASGDGEWVINGQKIWTSGAHYADYGILLVRTDPDAVKHKGLTMFWIDMKSPGIECKPIHQMSGARGFNEVFFTDLRVKDSQRLGALNDGWKVSIITLMNERASVGGGGGSPGGGAMSALRLAQKISDENGEPMSKDSAVREKIADWYVKSEGLRFTGLRSLTALSQGKMPGPEASVSKLVQAAGAQDIANEMVELQDQFGILLDEEVTAAGGQFQHMVMGAPGMRIAGGTDEILRNIIAERVLGMPGDIRVDKDLPFKDLPTGR